MSPTGPGFRESPPSLEKPISKAEFAQFADVLAELLEGPLADADIEAMSVLRTHKDSLSPELTNSLMRISGQIANFRHELAELCGHRGASTALKEFGRIWGVHQTGKWQERVNDPRLGGKSGAGGA